MSQPRYDAVVIGGGFYGCNIALLLAQHLGSVALIEQDADLLLRASYVNQARVHNGYHYPRSIQTARRSHLHYARFLDDFGDCIDRSFRHYYAIARRFSQVGPRQFETVCRRIGAPLKAAPHAIRTLFNPELIEEVYEVDEVAFDAAKLRATLAARLATAGVEVLLGRTVKRLLLESNGMHTLMAAASAGRGEETIATSRLVFNCTYSRLNALARAESAPLIPLRHELAEIAIVDLPPALQGLGFTVMCGPFFSTLPFPALGRHSLTHVRYTPHHAWEERAGGDPPGERPPGEHPSNFAAMRQDAARYIPLLKASRHVTSLWEVKTVLPQGEANDSRPILFQADPRLPGYISVLGSKLDNIYDLADDVQALVR